MKVRYQADADLDFRIVRATRRREPMIDFQSADEARADAGLKGVQDPAVLATAADEGRILLTHDRRTMPHHFAEFILARTSPGVLVLSQGAALGVAVDWLVLIWTASEAEEWENRIVFLA